MDRSELKGAGVRVMPPLGADEWKKFPAANALTPPEEMRKICLDFMRLQLSFRWTPAREYSYTSESEKRSVKFTPDTVYAGVPYAVKGSGSIYRMMEFYDHETGKVDLSEFEKMDPRYFGNDSSAAACIAWARCISSARMAYALGMTQLHGYVSVGPYTYMKELPLFMEGDPAEGDYTADEICLEMGREKMYESYACLKPADGVHSRGHVRMVSHVQVERGDAGEIDGEKSYILYMDQAADPSDTRILQEDGTPVSVQGGIDVKVDFKTLFDGHYLPFTFKEFLGEAKWAKPVVRTNGILCPVFDTEKLKEIELTANYPISDAFIEVKTREGELLYKDVYRCADHLTYTLALRDILKLSELEPFVTGENTLEVKFQLFNGALKGSWSGFMGTLCPGKPATEIPADQLDLAARLKAIPIAKEGMSPDELRKICLDFLTLQGSFPYKLKEDLNYWVDRQDHKVYFKKDEVHAGIPYVNIGSGTIYRWLEYYDPETGYVDMTELGKEKRIFGYACSGGVSTAWSRCITSARMVSTGDMTQARGYVNVGPYTYDKTLKSFKNEQRFNCRKVCRANGEQVMYESYALLKPADGLVCPGHVRMAAREPVVVRNEDGTINGEKSYVCYTEQGMACVSPYYVRRTENGDHYFIQGASDVPEKFCDLFKVGYLPITFKEFLGEAPVQKAMALPNIRKLCCNAEELEEIEINFNYPMSDAFYTITDVNGKVVMDGVWRASTYAVYNVALKRILPLVEMKFRLAPTEAPYKLNIEFQVFNGERLKGYDAFVCHILPGKGATATEVPESFNLKEQLDRIPIAKPGMRSLRLRQICLDYMKLQCQFPHTLSETVHYVIVSGKRPRPLAKGMVHGGLPYVTAGSGNLYRIVEAMDPVTGEIDGAKVGVSNSRYFGNACSGGVGTSWSRVVNSASFAYTNTMTEKNGFIAVGPYTYDKSLTIFPRIKKGQDRNYSPKNVVQENGEQTMFESYALMLPADGVVSGGHVRMNSAYPTVVRKEDGIIDGEKSYTLMTEQGCFATHSNNIRKFPDGSHYTAQGCVDIKYTFKELFDTYYIPFTFAEFIGTKEVEEGWVKLNTEQDALSAEDMTGLTLTANFPISDVFVTASDAEGKEEWIFRSPNFFNKEFALKEILPVEEIAAHKGKTLTVTCQLYNGEKLIAYTGKLK